MEQDLFDSVSPCLPADMYSSMYESNHDEDVKKHDNHEKTVQNLCESVSPSLPEGFPLTMHEIYTKGCSGDVKDTRGDGSHEKAELDSSETVSPCIPGDMYESDHDEDTLTFLDHPVEDLPKICEASVENASGPINMDSGTHKNLPLPPLEQKDYRTVPQRAWLGHAEEVNLENPYDFPSVASSGIYLPMRDFTNLFPESVGKRERLYRRTSWALLFLWITTLIAVVIVIASYHFQQIQHVCGNLPKNVTKESKSVSAKINDICIQLEDLDYFYSTRLKCVPNDTIHFSILSKMSLKQGPVLKPVWRWILTAADDVTMDPRTAHPKLVISENGKMVRLGKDQKRFSENESDRFDYVVNVLGKQGFTSGRHYWEVEVGNKTDWTLGVAERTVQKKGKLSMSPQEGFWTISLKDGRYGANNPRVLLSVSNKPQTVGVYVDYEAGQVSFYNVEATSHIYSFSDYNFTGKIHPLFRPGLSHQGRNSAPLTIK